MAVPPEPPSSRPSHRIRIFVVAVVVIVIILAAGLSVYWYEYQPGGLMNPRIVKIVNVSEVIWTLNGTAWTTSPGFSLEAGAQVNESVNEYCPPIVYYIVQRTCMSGEVYILTPGFSLVTTNAPFQWSSYNTGEDAAVTAVVSLPNSSFTGNLTIDLR